MLPFWRVSKKGFGIIKTIAVCVDRNVWYANISCPTTLWRVRSRPTLKCWRYDTRLPIYKGDQIQLRCLNSSRFLPFLIIIRAKSRCNSNIWVEDSMNQTPGVNQCGLWDISTMMNFKLYLLDYKWNVESQSSQTKAEYSIKFRNNCIVPCTVMRCLTWLCWNILL
jgi:hypothetical protein